MMDIVLLANVSGGDILTVLLKESYCMYELHPVTLIAIVVDMSKSVTLIKSWLVFLTFMY